MSMRDIIFSIIMEKLETSSSESLDEKVTNPYAIGMAAAMKASGDEPPLKKSTITKAHKIAKGIEKNEEVELDELNKKTLGSYVKKSADDLTHIQRDIGDTSNMKSPEYKKLSKLRSNRKAGINRAVNRLTSEEVEQIDEISADMKARYVSSAKKDLTKRFLKPLDPEHKTATGKAKKSWMDSPARKELLRKTDQRANIVNKLTSEEVDLDEAKTDIYHKHMLKALGKSRLPKDHQYTSSIANNGDFVVHDGGGRVAGRIAKSEHNLK